MKMIELRKMLRLKIMLHSDHASQKLAYLHTVMPMFNLLEYRQNYSMTSGSLCNYYRDEIDNIHDNASDGNSFKYKTKIVGKTAA